MSDVCLQGETSECGLACLSHVSKWFGEQVSLNELRSQFTPTELGTTLAELTELSNKIGIVAQPILFSIESLEALPTPCILHLKDSHYIVLEKANSFCCVVMNPALGRQILTTDIVKMGLSGYALNFEGDKCDKKLSNKFKGLLSRMNMKLDGPLLFFGLVSTILSILLPGALFNINNGFNDFNSIDPMMFVYLIVGQIISIVVLFVSEKRKIRIETATMVEKTTNTFTCMLNNKMSFFERRNSSDVANKALKFVAAKVTKSTIYNEFVINVIQAVAAIAVIVNIYPLLGIVVLCSSILSCFISLLSRNKLKEISTITEDHKEKIFRRFIDSYNNISDIKSSDALSDLSRVNIERLDEYSKFKIESGVSFLKFPISQQIIIITETILTLCLCLWLVEHKDVPLSAVFLFFYIKQFFSSAFQSVIDTNSSFGEIDAAESRGLDIIEFEKDTGVTNMPKYSGGLAKSNFSYALTNERSIDFPSFRLKPGETMAVIGRSGSGKTTLLKLLSGYFDEFYLNGDNNKVLKNRDLLDSFYFQSSHQDFFSATLKENLVMYNTTITDSQVLKVLCDFEIDYLIEELPGGLDTVISNYMNPFSSGEKQRLLLCRALLSDKEVLLLDEPTSNLDQKSTNLIIDRLKNYPKTVIFTTHNLESAHSVDVMFDISYNSGLEIDNYV